MKILAARRFETDAASDRRHWAANEVFDHPAQWRYFEEEIAAGRAAIAFHAPIRGYNATITLLGRGLTYGARVERERDHPKGDRHG